MSKILKRTLTVALICCMLLSVMAPLASASPEVPVTVTYNFQKTKSVTARTLYTSQTAPVSGTGWYYLKGTITQGTDSTHGIYNTNNTNNYHWQSVMITVPEAATYCITAEMSSGNTNWTNDARIYIAKADAKYNDTLTNLQRVQAMGADYAFKSQNCYTSNVNERIAQQMFGQSGIFGMTAYLGNTTLEAGEYIVLLYQLGSLKGYAGLRSLTLTESNDAAPFFKMINDDYAYAVGKQFYLCRDAVAENTDLRLSGSRIFTNGCSMTAKSVTANQSMNSGVTNVGILDNAGTTTIKTMNGKAPVMPAIVDNGGMVKKQLPLYNETTGAYEFVTPTTEFALKQDVQNPIIDEAAGTAKFVFKVTLPDEAYAMALAGNDPLTVTADWTVNGEEQTVLSFEGYMDDWTADADGNVFTVTIAGFDEIEETTEVTVTPKVAVGTNVITLATLSYEKAVA